jgi:hypothetical protein
MSLGGSRQRNGFLVNEASFDLPESLRVAGMGCRPLFENYGSSLARSSEPTVSEALNSVRRFFEPLPDLPARTQSLTRLDKDERIELLHGTLDCCSSRPDNEIRDHIRPRTFIVACRPIWCGGGGAAELGNIAMTLGHDARSAVGRRLGQSMDVKP